MSAPNKPVQRNFMLPPEQAEWLREYAFQTRRKQVEVVREALAEYRTRTEAVNTGEAGSRNRQLVARFSSGSGIDLDLLVNDSREMWDDG